MQYARGHAYDILIPNFYFERFEMDLFKLNDGGMVTEYEIKISRSDFKNDFTKCFEVYDKAAADWRTPVKKLKHEELAAGRLKVNRFWFVVPAGLIELKEVPKHAGLLQFNKYGGFDVVKNAPLLTKERPAIDFKDLCRSLSFREQNFKNKLVRK